MDKNEKGHKKIKWKDFIKGGWDAMKNDPYESDSRNTSHSPEPSVIYDPIGKKKEYIINDNRICPDIFGVERVYLASFKVVHSKAPLSRKQLFLLEKYYPHI